MGFGFVVLTAWLGLNVWATRRVLASEEDAARKKWFIAGVWLIPIFGALILRNLGARAAVMTEKPEEHREPAPLELVLPSGAVFDVQQHLALANGVPLLDWEAAQRAADAEASGAAAALAAMQHAWLLHLRDAIGPHCRLASSQDAMVLSSLDDVTVNALLRYVATTRSRVTRLLDGIARFEPGQKSIVLVLDDEDSYYQYVANYYPEEGEFAFSGGMFLAGACPHFVVKRGELQSLESVIAHELTHSAVAHLQLPLWIDEGLAVNTEHRLTGSPRTTWTPQQLHGKHLAFWDAQRIQEFWTGHSFQRTDDGNLLSYELARILVQEMSRDWPSFAAFVQEARREDAGHAAALRMLGTDLGHAVCALFDREVSAAWSPEASTAPSAQAA